MTHRDKDLSFRTEQKRKSTNQTYNTLKHFAKNRQKIFKTAFIRKLTVFQKLNTKKRLKFY